MGMVYCQPDLVETALVLPKTKLELRG
jgi:hypothetical protein